MKNARVPVTLLLVAAGLFGRALPLGCGGGDSTAADADGGVSSQDGALGEGGSVVVPTGPGSLDPTFGSAGLVREAVTGSKSFVVSEAALAPDDGVVFVASYYSGFPADVLGKLGSTGLVDKAFAGANVQSKFLRRISFFATTLAMMPDGRFLVVGADTHAAQAMRVLPTGEPDPGLPQTTLFGDVIDTGKANGAVLDTDDSWTVGGRLEPGAPQSTPRVFLLRLARNGSTTKLGDGGIFSYQPPYERVAPRIRTSDGRYLCEASGFDGVVKFATVIHVDAAGVIDTSFGQNGRASLLQFSADRLLPQPNDGFLVAGALRSDEMHVGISRFVANGTLDPTFGSGGVVALPVKSSGAALALQADGKIVVATNVDAGDATGLTRIVVFRYSPTGTLDTGFGANGVFEVPVPNVTNASASTVHVQKSGRIVVVGSADDTTGPSLLAVGIKP